MVSIVGSARVLEVVNTGSDDAKRITVQLTHDLEDASEFLLGAVPNRIVPRGRVALPFSPAPGPQDFEVSLQWVDEAGIPGVWHGVVRRF